MTWLALAAAGVLTAPRWLPEQVVALRVKVFEKVNGDNAITFPNATVGPDRFREVYGHPSANGRSKGAGLSDLFWYWLSPGPEVHQEHLEAGPRYDDVARTTLALLAGPSESFATAASRCARRVLDELVPGRVTLVRLRDLAMPLWAEYFYELVFGEPCPRAGRELIVAHANDVVTSLKCTGLRHPRRRAALTRYLATRVTEVRVALPASLSAQEQVHYLQGTFFNTAVVQMSEAFAHLVLALAQHPEVAERAGHDDRYFAHVLDETFRRYPLFGIAHRITTGEIELDENTTLPTGSVLCFSYPDYHASGYAEPEKFDPDRWAHLSAKTAHHIPFGIAANRPCPAWRISPIALRAATREVLRRFTLHSTVAHTRSLPHRGPCLLVRKGQSLPVTTLALIGAGLRLRDRWEDVWRSVVQLVLGTAMVLDARRLRLAERYFATHDTHGCPVPHRSEVTR
ncbi:cytochrome P450 [Labedaea rhizosphaerae]|nr:cytochrome P450 [Labedaea rhizosphaerae]